jgi:hypothetical protein
MSKKGSLSASAAGVSAASGIPEWEASIPYGFETLVKRDGNIFSSLIPLNLGADPLLDASLWSRISSTHSPLLFGTGVLKGGELSLDPTIIFDSIQDVPDTAGAEEVKFVMNAEYGVLSFNQLDGGKFKRALIIYNVATKSFGTKNFVSDSGDNLQPCLEYIGANRSHVAISPTTNSAVATWCNGVADTVITGTTNLALGTWDSYKADFTAIYLADDQSVSCTPSYGLLWAGNKSPGKRSFFRYIIASRDLSKLDITDYSSVKATFSPNTAGTDDFGLVVYNKTNGSLDTLSRNRITLSYNGAGNTSSDSFSEVEAHTVEEGVQVLGDTFIISRIIRENNNNPWPTSKITQGYQTVSTGSYFGDTLIDGNGLLYYNARYKNNGATIDPKSSVIWLNGSSGNDMRLYGAILSQESTTPLLKSLLSDVVFKDDSYNDMDHIKDSVFIAILDGDKVSFFSVSTKVGSTTYHSEISSPGKVSRNPNILFYKNSLSLEGIFVYYNETDSKIQFREFEKGGSPTLAVSGGEGLIQGKKVTWAPAQFSPTPDPDTVYYTFINQNATFFWQLTPLTATQARENISLGVAKTDDAGLFSTVTKNPATLRINDDVRELSDAIGAVSLTGNLLTHIPGTGQGTFSLSEGSVFKIGSNNIFENVDNPNIITKLPENPVNFAYGYIDNLGDLILSSASSVVDFSNFSDNGVLSSVGINNYSIQRVYISVTALDFVPAETLILYGTEKYLNQSSAMDGISTEVPPLPSFISNFLLRGYVVTEGNSTTPIVKVIEANKFGE